MEGPERRGRGWDIKQTGSISEQLDTEYKLRSMHNLVTYPHFSSDKTEVQANDKLEATWLVRHASDPKPHGP